MTRPIKAKCIDCELPSVECIGIIEKGASYMLPLARWCVPCFSLRYPLGNMLNEPINENTKSVTCFRCQCRIKFKSNNCFYRIYYRNAANKTISLFYYCQDCYDQDINYSQNEKITSYL